MGAMTHVIELNLIALHGELGICWFAIKSQTAARAFEAKVYCFNFLCGKHQS
jgi:hypothetical protein